MRPTPRNTKKQKTNTMKAIDLLQEITELKNEIEKQNQILKELKVGYFVQVKMLDFKLRHIEYLVYVYQQN